MEGRTTSQRPLLFVFTDWIWEARVIVRADPGDAVPLKGIGLPRWRTTPLETPDSNVMSPARPETGASSKAPSRAMMAW
jgi:hypothetical protein